MSSWSLSQLLAGLHDDIQQRLEMFAKPLVTRHEGRRERECLA